MSGKIAVLYGSPRDADKMAGAIKMLAAFDVPFKEFAKSAHRDADWVAEFARTAISEGYEGIIAGAGMANHLAGAIAGKTRLPVYGVPLSGGVNGGTDSLLSTVQMPPGVPVACVAVDGSANAAILAIQQLARHNRVLDRKLRGFKERGSNVRAPMPFHGGKVRDSFAFEGHPEWMLQWTSNRLSAFDWVLEDPITGKGEVLTRLSKYWLMYLANFMPTHWVDIANVELPDWAQPLSSQITVVKKLNMIPLECIVRGYLEGSAWREYQKEGTMHGQKMPKGMVRCQQLDEPTFTPSTKAAEGQHDQNIDFKQSVEIVGRETAEAVRAASLRLYDEGMMMARQNGVLILDTKFEFGFDPTTGELTLADEVFTPDSSRFVDAHTFVPGQAPESMDKEYVRTWLKSTGWDPNGEVPPPPLPQHVIWETARRYQEIAQRICA